MTIEKLRQVHSDRPFRPFVIRMADGTKLRITHPESLAYSQSGRTLVYVAPDDTHHHIDLLLVARLEVENGTGHRPRRR